MAMYINSPEDAGLIIVIKPLSAIDGCMIGIATNLTWERIIAGGIIATEATTPTSTTMITIDIISTALISEVGCVRNVSYWQRRLL